MSETRITRTEPEGVAARPILYTAVGFLIFVAACLGGLYAYYSGVVTGQMPAKPEPFPTPQLQRTPLSDLEKLQQMQQAQLQGYAWVDKKQGLVLAFRSSAPCRLSPQEEAPQLSAHWTILTSLRRRQRERTKRRRQPSRTLPMGCSDNSPSRHPGKAKPDPGSKHAETPPFLRSRLTLRPARTTNC